MDSFPPLVITDLREPHGITAKIRQKGSRHISIHDLGLAQCRSDVVIDGSIARLFPYPADPNRLLYLGPQYMIMRPPVQRGELNDTVLLTFGGGSTVDFAQRITEQLYGLGLTVIATRGFVGPVHMRDERLARAMSSCRFAVSGSGVSLYELAASGVPTIAVAFDRLELRTADAFQELGAALCAGLMEDVTPTRMLCHATELMNNRSLVLRLARAGPMLVDGKGLSRVVDIVRRQIWLASQTKTYMTC
jgi:spore coat polysaccharide biosynthesis predicted glycosyltransferase SpsG